MINLLRILTYPSVSLNQVNQLPRKPGVYYCLKDFEVQYVGLSRSLHKRWTAIGDRRHHRKSQLQAMGNVRLHYRLCSIQELEYLEALEIKRFNPPLNVLKPNPNNYLTWKLWVKSTPVLIGALALAIVGLGIVEIVDSHQRNQRVETQMR